MESNDSVKEWAVVVFPSGDEFVAEIAADPEARRIGYMFRERVGPREGMLFLFDADERHSFWMKNCKVALDLVWLDASWRVVHIEGDRKPCPENGDCPSIVPFRPARYVLEVAGGTWREQGLKIGDRITVLSERFSP